MLEIVTSPGHAASVWEHFVAAVPAPISPNLPPILAETKAISISDHIFFAQNRAEDIAHVGKEGFEVYDDNDTAPKNVPGPDAPPVWCKPG